VWSAAATDPDGAARRARRAGIDEATAAAVIDLAGRPASPVTTSAGRLFDAVAAMLGGRQRVTYEAQAAIELEAWARSIPRHEAPHYDGCVTVERDGDLCVLDPAPLVAAILADVDGGTDRSVIAAGFHEALGRATVLMAVKIAADCDIGTIALTGGVFQNARLTDVVEDGLRDQGFEVLVHSSIPPNDGGISVGQAAIAAAGLGAKDTH